MSNLAKIRTVEDFDAYLKLSYEKADTVVDAKFTKADDMYPCGFAWTRIVIDGRSRMGKIIAKSGEFRKSYVGRGYRNSTNGNGIASQVQNVTIKLAWQEVVTEELLKLGLVAYAESRWD